MTITVNRSGFMKEQLNDGQQTEDDKDKPCLKCNFIKHSNLKEIYKSDIEWGFARLSRVYWSLMGIYNNKVNSRFREEYPKLSEKLDEYEERLMNGEHKGRLKQRFLKEIKGLVEFV